MEGKALRKHSLHEKTAASVLLKLFISSNDKTRQDKTVYLNQKAKAHMVKKYIIIYMQSDE